MSPDAATAVREACDAVMNDGQKCDWPDCDCRLAEEGRTISAIIAAAEARGAERERAETDKALANLGGAVLQDVLDFDDRTSPEDWPEACLVTGEELTGLIDKHLSLIRERQDIATAILALANPKEGTADGAN